MREERVGDLGREGGGVRGERGGGGMRGERGGGES